MNTFFSLLQRTRLSSRVTSWGVFDGHMAVSLWSYWIVGVNEYGVVLMYDYLPHNYPSYRLEHTDTTCTKPRQ